MMRDFGFCNKFIRYSFTNLEFRTHKFSLNICYDFFFQLAKWKKLFWTYKNFVFFFNCSNGEKLANQIGENI